MLHQCLNSCLIWAFLFSRFFSSVGEMAKIDGRDWKWHQKYAMRLIIITMVLLFMSSLNLQTPLQKLIENIPNCMSIKSIFSQWDSYGRLKTLDTKIIIPELRKTIILMSEFHLRKKILSLDQIREVF